MKLINKQTDSTKSDQRAGSRSLSEASVLLQAHIKIVGAFLLVARFHAGRDVIRAKVRHRLPHVQLRQAPLLLRSRGAPVMLWRHNCMWWKNWVLVNFIMIYQLNLCFCTKNIYNFCLPLKYCVLLAFVFGIFSMKFTLKLWRS